MVGSPSLSLSLSLLAREREKGNREKKEGKEREERVRGEKRRAQAYYRSEKGSPQKVPSERGKLGRKQVSGCSGHFWDLLQVIFEIVVPYNAFSKACEARGNEKKNTQGFQLLHIERKEGGNACNTWAMVLYICVQNTGYTQTRRKSESPFCNNEG